MYDLNIWTLICIKCYNCVVLFINSDLFTDKKLNYKLNYLYKYLALLTIVLVLLQAFLTIKQYQYSFKKRKLLVNKFFLIDKSLCL